MNSGKVCDKEFIHGDFFFMSTFHSIGISKQVIFFMMDVSYFFMIIGNCLRAY